MNREREQRTCGTVTSALLPAHAPDVTHLRNPAVPVRIFKFKKETPHQNPSKVDNSAGKPWPIDRTFSTATRLKQSHEGKSLRLQIQNARVVFYKTQRLFSNNDNAAFHVSSFKIFQIFW
jgi:hypothetical protein